MCLRIIATWFMLAMLLNKKLSPTMYLKQRLFRYPHPLNRHIAIVHMKNSKELTSWLDCNRKHFSVFTMLPSGLKTCLCFCCIPTCLHSSLQHCFSFSGCDYRYFSIIFARIFSLATNFRFTTIFNLLPKRRFNTFCPNYYDAHQL